MVDKKNSTDFNIHSEHENKIPSELLRDVGGDIEEFSEWLIIGEYYRDLEKTTNVPSDRMFFKISRKISGQSEATAVGGIKSRIFEVFRSLWFPWALVVAQALVILFFLVPEHGVKYSTLSSSLHHENSVTYLNVVFDDKAREADIRNLLIKLGAEIVGGPEPNGLYIVKISGIKSDKAIKSKLQGTKIIKFWAPRY